jgi:membrane protease YdiL (CAAX protease family)
MSKHSFSSTIVQSDTALSKNRIGQILQQHPLSTFFVLTYLIAWSVYAIQAGLFPFQLPEPISDFLVNWAPGFAAIIVVAALGGLGGIRALLRPLLKWRVSLEWYTVALFLSPLLVFAAIGISLLFGGPTPQFSRTFGPQLALLPVLLFFNMGEEIGWRGFALPRLQARQSALVASLVLGVVWGFWHAPKFFLTGQLANELLFFLVFMVSIIAQTILMTWVYNNTGGSLLLATLFHFSSDAFLTFFLPAWVSPSGVPHIFAIMTLLQVGVAILVVMHYGPSHLSRQPKKAATVIIEAEKERVL